MSECKDVKSMNDKIESLGNGSVIQHGRHNNRIYLIKLDKYDFPVILNNLRELASENSYSKIFCKIPYWAAPGFFADGFITEAIIPGFFKGRGSAFFVSKFMDSDRLLNLEKKELEEFSSLSRTIYKKEPLPEDRSLKLSLLDSSDIEEITELYRQVFLSYPFPIHNPGYILKTMQENVKYFGIRKNRQLIAVSSAEIDYENHNAEMTDFATDPKFRGLKLGQRLLSAMEKEMRKIRIPTLYTIARLKSIPMNKVFLKNQYTFGGTLIKNTNIAGSIESMNVLYKHI